MTGTPETVTPASQGVTPRPGSVTAGEEVRRVATARGVTVAELVEQLRDVATAIARDPGLCDWCEGPMPSTATSRAKRWCSQDCRKEASRDRVARRLAKRRAADAGAREGTCDVCGRSCHIDDALCDGCIDDLNERYRAAIDAAQEGRADG